MGFLLRISSFSLNSISISSVAFPLLSRSLSDRIDAIFDNRPELIRSHAACFRVSPRSREALYLPSLSLTPVKQRFPKDFLCFSFAFDAVSLIFEFYRNMQRQRCDLFRPFPLGCIIARSHYRKRPKNWSVPFPNSYFFNCRNRPCRNIIHNAAAIKRLLSLSLPWLSAIRIKSSSGKPITISSSR